MGMMVSYLLTNESRAWHYQTSRVMQTLKIHLWPNKRVLIKLKLNMCGKYVVVQFKTEHTQCWACFKLRHQLSHDWAHLKFNLWWLYQSLEGGGRRVSNSNLSASWVSPDRGVQPSPPLHTWSRKFIALVTDVKTQTMVI